MDTLSLFQSIFPSIELLSLFPAVDCANWRLLLRNVYVMSWTCLARLLFRRPQGGAVGVDRWIPSFHGSDEQIAASDEEAKVRPQSFVRLPKTHLRSVAGSASSTADDGAHGLIVRCASDSNRIVYCYSFEGLWYGCVEFDCHSLIFMGKKDGLIVF